MNAHEGAICRVVSPGNEMTIVVAQRLLAANECDDHGVFSPAWYCELLSPFVDDFGRLALPGKGVDAAICDILLRPLHDGDGVDESLSWAKVPSDPVECHPKHQPNL